MKKIFLSLVAFSVVLAVKAQEIPERKTDHHPMHEKKQGMRRHHGMDMKNLNLTEAQKEQYKKEKEGFQKQMEELKKNDNITVKDWRSRMENMRKEHKAKLEGILTLDQKAQIEKNKEQGKAKRQEYGKKRAEMMKTRLGLTDDQSAKMEKNHKELMEKMKTLREDKSLSEDKKREQMRELLKNQRESLKSILTEEQLQKMKENKKDGHRKEGKKTVSKEI